MASGRTVGRCDGVKVVVRLRVAVLKTVLAVVVDVKGKNGSTCGRGVAMTDATRAATKGKRDLRLVKNMVVRDGG